MTYSDMINLSMNQTLARSINTSLVAILPVLAVLVVGAEILGATTLQDYGLALVVGLLSGAYSSIFIASPVLAVLKEREPRYRAIRQKLEIRGEPGTLTPTGAAMLAGAGAECDDRPDRRHDRSCGLGWRARSRASSRPSGPLPPLRPPPPSSGPQRTHPRRPRPRADRAGRARRRAAPRGPRSCGRAPAPPGRVPTVGDRPVGRHNGLRSPAGRRWPGAPGGTRKNKHKGKKRH